MKTIEMFGMKRPVCANCFEYPENCLGCEWHKCVICGEEFAASEIYEYRGIYACKEHIDEVREKRDYQRKEVIKITEKSIRSQREGEFINNRKKYNLRNVAPDGLPIIKPKEPQALKDYEEGKL